MSELLQFWLVILVLAAGTFLLRSIPIWAHGRVPTPQWFTRILRYVPPAALAALVVPGSLYDSANGAYELAPAKGIAAIVALVIAWRSKNVTATLTVGMIALWLMQAILPG